MTSQDQVPQHYAQPTPQHFPPPGDPNAAPQHAAPDPHSGEPGYYGHAQPPFNAASPHSYTPHAPSPHGYTTPFPATPTRKSGWPNVGMILAGALGAVGVFLPIASFFGQTFNWLTPGLSGSTQTEGIILLVVSGLAILLGLLSLLVPRTWARVLAGIIGLLAGALIAFDGLRNIPTMNELAGSAGTGLYVLGAAGVALVIFSLIVLFRRRA